MKEAYCSYEISKLLKEKGFDESTLTFYIPFEDGEVKFNIGSNEIHYNTLNEYPWIIAAPTHQMALEWLRDVYHTFIEISTSIDLNGNYHFSYTILDKECKYVRRGYTDFDWNYEDAVEAAIKYCLENLINYES